MRLTGRRWRGRRRPGPGRHDEAERNHEHDHRRPLVDAQPQHFGREVDPHAFDPEPAERVSGHVHREQPSPFELLPITTLDQQHNGDDEQVPKRFVEECGVECGPVGEGRRTLGLGYFERPRQLRRAAEQLDVEPVPPAADGLRERYRRRDRVEQRADGHVPSAGHDHTDGDTEGHATPDAEAALPDLHDVEPAPTERLPIGGHVVQAGPDHPGRHTPGGDGADVGWVAAAGQPSTVGQPHRSDDAERDAEAVGAHLQRADREAASRRTRDERQHTASDTGRSCIHPGDLSGASPPGRSFP